MKSKILQLVCVAFLLGMTACSTSSKKKELLQQIPANMDLVAVGDVKMVVESVGGSLEGGRLKLPSYLTSEFKGDASESYEEVVSALKKSGVDPEVVALTTNFKRGWNQPIFLFKLSDPKKFEEFLDDADYTEKDSEDGVTFYAKKVYESSYNSDYDDYGYVAVKGSYAYWIERVWVGSKFKAVKELQSMIEEAQTESFADTKCCDYILSGNVGGVSVKIPNELKKEMRKAKMPKSLVDAYGGYICVSGQLDQKSATVKMQWFDENGEKKSGDELAHFMNPDATINERALSFLDKEEFLACAMSIKGIDWDKYVDLIVAATGQSRASKVEIKAVINYFEKINGTIAFGIGIADGLESIAKMSAGHDVTNQLSCTMVLETKEGKAKSFMEDMKGLLEMAEMPFNESNAGFTIDLSKIGESGVIYAKYVDDFIVIANHPIKENNQYWTADMNWGTKQSAFGVNLDKKNKFMQDLDIKKSMRFTIYGNPKTMESYATFEVDGDENTGVLEKTARIVMDFIERSDDVERRVEELRRKYMYYSSYEVEDEETEEPVVVSW